MLKEYKLGLQASFLVSLLVGCKGGQNSSAVGAASVPTLLLEPQEFRAVIMELKEPQEFRAVNMELK